MFRLMNFARTSAVLFAVALPLTVPTGALAQRLPANTNRSSSTSLRSFIAGGSANVIYSNSRASFIGGGQFNAVPYLGTSNAVIGGGYNNRAESSLAVIGGGSDNRIVEQANNAVIGGGQSNVVRYRSTNATAGGGSSNIVGGLAGTIAGGAGNLAGAKRESVYIFDKNYATVGGGLSNIASASNSTIGGGGLNEALGDYSFVGGGWQNTVSSNALNAFIGGGYTNRASGAYSVVAGGKSNSASGVYSVVAGGQSNSAGEWGASVAGGQLNNASGAYSAIGGGSNNAAGAIYATVPGGTRAKANNNGAFVWSGADSVDTESTNANSFTVRAPGGVRFISTLVDSTTVTSGAYNTNNTTPLTNGVFLAPNSGAWASLSDSNAKTKVVAIKPREVLSKVAALPVTEWEYKVDPNRRYIGPMAQDFHAAFGLGSDDKSITTLDSDGVMYAAIQGLVEELKERDTKHTSDLAERDARIETLEKELRAIREQISKLPPAP